MPASKNRVTGRGRAAQNLRLASSRRAQEEEKDEEELAEEEEETPTSKRGKGRKANEPTEEKEDEPAGKSKGKKTARAEDDEEEQYAEGEGDDDDMEDDVDAKATAAAQNVLAAERKRVSSLRAEFSDDPKFAMKAVDKGWTVTQAKAHYADVLRSRQGKNSQSQTVGNQPLTRRGSAADIDDDDADYEGDGDGGPARCEVDRRIQKLVATGMRRDKAHAKVMRDDPQLREQLVAEHNAAHRIPVRR